MELFSRSWRLYWPKQKAVVLMLNPKKLCHTCMATFHSKKFHGLGFSNDVWRPAGRRMGVIFGCGRRQSRPRNLSCCSCFINEPSPASFRLFSINNTTFTTNKWETRSIEVVWGAGFELTTSHYHTIRAPAILLSNIVKWTRLTSTGEERSTWNLKKTIFTSRSICCKKQASCQVIVNWREKTIIKIERV